MSDNSYYKKQDDSTGFTYQDWEPKCLGEYSNTKQIFWNLIHLNLIFITIRMSIYENESFFFYSNLKWNCLHFSSFGNIEKCKVDLFTRAWSRVESSCFDFCSGTWHYCGKCQWARISFWLLHRRINQYYRCLNSF